MIREFLISSLSSDTLFSIGHHFSEFLGTTLLYSGGSLDSAQTSFLALFPFETIQAFGCEIHYKKGSDRRKITVNNPWNGLQEYFFSSMEKETHSIAFGWLGYGMGIFTDEVIASLYRPSDYPDAYWQRCAIVITFDHFKQEGSIRVDLRASEYLEGDAKEWFDRLSTLQSWNLFLSSIPQVSDFLPIFSSPSYVEGIKKEITSKKFCKYKNGFETGMFIKSICLILFISKYLQIHFLFLNRFAKLTPLLFQLI